LNSWSLYSKLKIWPVELLFDTWSYCFLIWCGNFLIFNLIHNSLIAFQFSPILHPIRTRWRPNQGQTKGREMKEIDDQTKLVHCGHVYNSSRKFNRLIQVNQVDLIWRHLFISLNICFSQFYHLTISCFTFKSDQVKQML
jgi:hypothetical protein